MRGKNSKSSAKLPCLDTDCLARHHQVANEKIHEDKLVVQSANESKIKFDGIDTKDLESLEVVENDIQRSSENSSSFLHAVVNMVGMLIGLGQLSTPYALEKGGWVSAFLLVALGIICAYSSHLLGKCLEKNPRSTDYKDIGQHAYGSRGRIIAATFIYVEIFMSLVSYTISLHDNLATVFLGTHLNLSLTKNLTTSQILTIIAVSVALPSIWLRNLSSISFLSTGGILMSLLILGTVACTAMFGGVKANHKIPALQIQNIPAISGLYMFSFAGHIVFPNLYAAMKDPSKFTKVMLALEFAPFAIQLEQNLPPKMKTRTKMIIRGTVGSILLLIILVLALSVPYFEHVLSLTGSLVSVGICVVFPCAFHTKIFWNQISKPALILNIVLIAIGTLLGASGTISSSKLLIKTLRRAHSG